MIAFGAHLLGTFIMVVRRGFRMWGLEQFVNKFFDSQAFDFLLSEFINSRAHRGLDKMHLGFSGRFVTFFLVAFTAGSDDISPAMVSSSGFGHNMIQRWMFMASSPTILTYIFVPNEDIIAVQRDLFFVKLSDKLDQANNEWNRNLFVDAADHLSRILQNFDLALHDQVDSSLPTDVMKVGIICIQNNNAHYSIPLLPDMRGL
jgi:hypothetical protein